MKWPIIQLSYYTKPECELCQPFLKIIQSVMSEYSGRSTIEFECINIENNQEAWEKYWDKIPVLEINGTLAFKYFIDKKALQKKIQDLGL